MVQKKLKIISNAQVIPGYFKINLEAGEIAKEARPGQFIHVRVHEKLDPLLRRPFSIHRLTGSRIEVLYKIRGRATQILSERKSGELLDIIGPLGNGFSLSEHKDTGTQDTSILVAGGFGVAPLVFLAEELVRNQESTVHVLIGAKSKDAILCQEDFRKIGCKVEIATEDGSLGHKGLVTELLKDRLSTVDYRLSTVYAAGPNFMLQEIKQVAKMFKILSFGSLEENIACGLGGCFGCAVKTVQGYKRVCKDGPVFNLEDIAWE